jgi:hypothetical protein
VFIALAGIAVTGLAIGLALLVGGAGLSGGQAVGYLPAVGFAALLGYGRRHLRTAASRRSYGDR